MHGQTEFIGVLRHGSQRIQIITDFAAVALRRFIRYIGLTHIGSQALNHAVELDLDIGHLKHAAGTLCHALSGAFHTGHGIPVAEYLISAIAADQQTAFGVEFIIGLEQAFRAVQVDHGLEVQGLAISHDLALVVEDGFLILFDRILRRKVCHKEGGTLSEAAGGIAFTVAGNDAVADIGRGCVNAKGLHGSRIDPVGMIVFGDEDDRLVGQVIQHGGCGTVGIKAAVDPACTGNDVQVRIFCDEGSQLRAVVVDGGAFEQGDLKQLRHAAGMAVGVCVGQAGQDHAVSIVQNLCILTQIGFGAGGVADIDKDTVLDGSGLRTRLLSVNGVDVSVDDRVRSFSKRRGSEQEQQDGQQGKQFFHGGSSFAFCRRLSE